MEHMHYREKFDPLELKMLQDELVGILDPVLATEEVARFLSHNGYGADSPAIHEMVANGMSKEPFEKFRQHLEDIAREN
jgi:hypothetical protein